MYSSVGQQDGTVEQLSGQTIWNNDFDKEYSNYIDPSVFQEMDELPRATSAPPHLQARFGAASADILNRSSRLQGLDNYTDIRYDEDYAAFYELHRESDNLPPPIDGSTLYNDMQSHFQQAQQHKENALYAGSMTRLGSGQNPYGLGLYSSQNSLSKAGLETVEEQPTVKKEQTDESVVDALNQFHIGNEIQRPGSQPAPNLLQAIAAEHGHYRSASALASFNLDGMPNIPGNVPAPTSSPGLTSSSTLNSMMHQNTGNDYLSQIQQQQTGGPALTGSLEYQAAYEAALRTALMQSHSNQQMMLSPQMPNSQTAHAGMNIAQAQAPAPTPANYSAGGASGAGGAMQTHGLANDMSLLAANMQQQSSMHSYYPTQGGNPSNQAAGVVPIVTNANNNVGLSATGSGGSGGGGGVYSPHHQAKETHFPKEEQGNRGKRYARREIRDREQSYPSAPQSDSYFESQYIKFNSIEEVVGQVIHVAQDQNGCRFLQRKFDEGGAQAIEKVFPEILENIVHLMKDPFGNYLIQKLLDRCSEAQRTDVVKAVADGGELISIALSTHGTRAVQKLIETLTTKEQRQLAIAALKPGVVHLIKDLNGNHVVQRCLQRLGPEDSQFIYDAAIGCCVEIASHRHGCCVLQRCIDFATRDQRHSMIMEISSNALVLSQDAFGNYVVQYVLDLGEAEASHRIMTVLNGHYSDLAVQKFSSNVVEKCLKLGQLDDSRETIIKEIMHSPALPRLLQDPYGNYVVQSALSVTSGSLHQSLVECIRPYLPTLRGTPHGKRILQKVLASLKDPF